MDVWFDPVQVMKLCWTTGRGLNGRQTTSRERPVSRLVPVLAADCCSYEGEASYRSVLSHGWVVDGEGRNVQIPWETLLPRRIS